MCYLHKGEAADGKIPPGGRNEALEDMTVSTCWLSKTTRATVVSGRHFYDVYGMYFKSHMRGHRKVGTWSPLLSG